MILKDDKTVEKNDKATDENKEKNMSASMLLLEKHNDIIESKYYSPISKELKADTAYMIEQCEKYINEDLNVTTDLQDYKEMIVPIFRESVSKTVLMEVVGLQPINQSPSLFYVERLYYGGTDANGAGALLRNPARASGEDPFFETHVIRVEMSEVQYGQVVEGTSYIKAAGGGGSNIAKVIYKEETTGGAKLLVKLESGESMLPVGTVYVTGPNADLNMSNVWDNQIGRSVILSNYGGPILTSEAELNQDIPVVKVSLESVQVNALSHQLAFEVSHDLVVDFMRRTGTDATKRLIGAINWQLAMSVNQKLFNLMTSNATIKSSWTYAGADGRYEAEKLDTLKYKVKHEQNNIATRNQKGRGNFAIVTSNVMSVIETFTGFVKFIAAEGGDQAGVVKVGNLDGITYYMTTLTYGGDFMLMGYKGSEQHDAGVFYCPMYPIQIAQANDYKNPHNKKTAFLQRAAYEPHPLGADRYLTYFDIDLTGSQMAG